jgi:hypothetical protein
MYHKVTTKTTLQFTCKLYTNMPACSKPNLFLLSFILVTCMYTLGTSTWFTTRTHTHSAHICILLNELKASTSACSKYVSRCTKHTHTHTNKHTHTHTNKHIKDIKIFFFFNSQLSLKLIWHTHTLIYM